MTFVPQARPSLTTAGTFALATLPVIATAGVVGEDVHEICVVMQPVNAVNNGPAFTPGTVHTVDPTSQDFHDYGSTFITLYFQDDNILKDDRGIVMVPMMARYFNRVADEGGTANVTLTRAEFKGGNGQYYDLSLTGTVSTLNDPGIAIHRGEYLFGIQATCDFNRLIDEDGGLACEGSFSNVNVTYNNVDGYNADDRSQIALYRTSCHNLRTQQEIVRAQKYRSPTFANHDQLDANTPPDWTFIMP